MELMDRSPSQDIGNKLYNRAESIIQSATNVHYEHAKESARKQVDFENGSCSAHNDCSGFISYLLVTDAPKHYDVLKAAQPNAHYPQAKTYAQFFSELSSNDPQNGWLKVDLVADLKRGDLIAWAKQKPPGQKRGNTGHVMMVAEPPTAVTEEMVDGKPVRYSSIVVIDSSSVDHFPPDQLPPHAKQEHRDGVGKGTVRIVLDGADNPIGYWEETYWNEGHKPIEHPSYTPIIGFARLASLRN